MAETIVAGDSVRRANLAAAALGEAADPSQVVQLRLVLRAFESRVANLALTGRPVRFRDLGHAERERYLLGWATSRIPQRRTAYQGLKRLLAFLAYADPGEDGANSRLAATGYAHRPEPVAAEPTPIRPLDLADLGTTRSAGPLVLEADVVVVGSGAAGGVVAADLARAGRSVVVLEAGPFAPEPEMPVDELAAFDRLYLNKGLNASWDAGVLTLVGTGVGGGTLVNWGTSLRPPDCTLRRWARRHGLEGVDGPTMEADLAAVEADLAVGPSHMVPPKDAALVRGCAELGWDAAVTRRNGAGCGDCGRCGFGCRRGAKQSGIRVHLADAWRAGARIVPDAAVRRVLLEGGRAVGAEASAVVGGVPRTLVARAPVVVVAAGTLRTPLVLARSGLDHPALGRHLRLHPVSVAAGVLDEDVLMWEGTPQAARSLQFLATAPDESPDGGFILESAPGTPGLIALVFPWEGRAAFTGLMARVRRVSPILGIVREHGEGRVRLTRAGRARIDYAIAPADAGELRRALAAAARVLRAAGAREIVAVGTPPSWYRAHGDVGATAFEAWVDGLAGFPMGANRGTVLSAHQMGTARAGADPRDHACDPWGRVRTNGARPGRDATVPGLWVADASLFPTSLGVNPMLTTMAMARRTARAVVAEAPGR